MVKLKTIIIILAAAGLGLFAFYRYYQSDESRINRQFKRLAEWGSKESGEQNLSMAVRVKKLETLFGKECRVEAPEYSRSKTYAPSEIGNIARMAAGKYTAIGIRFLDLNISVENRTAASVCTVRISTLQPGGEAIESVQEVECILKKTGQEWLFHEIKLVDVLEK